MKKKAIIKDTAATAKSKIHAIFGVTPWRHRKNISTRYAQEQDADGIVVCLCRPISHPDRASVLEYLIDVCLSVDISVGLYNNPARVVANVNAESVITLFNSVPNLVADKAMPNVGQIATIQEGTHGELPVLRFARLRPYPAGAGLWWRGNSALRAISIPGLWLKCHAPGKILSVQRTRRIYNELLPIMEACYLPF